VVLLPKSQLVLKRDEMLVLLFDFVGQRKVFFFKLKNSLFLFFNNLSGIFIFLGKGMLKTFNFFLQAFNFIMILQQLQFRMGLLILQIVDLLSL